jgi:GAF domain-containing protein
LKRQAWQELAILWVFFIVFSLIWAPADLAFAKARPHPYLIIVLVMAARHGLSAALSAVVTCAVALLVLSRQGVETVQLQDLIARPWNFILAQWIVLGAAVGAATDAHRRTQYDLEKRLGFLQKEFADNSRQLELTEAENLELRKKVFGEGVTLTTVYGVARKLITLAGKELFEASLELVERFVGADQCSIYLLDKGRKAFLLKETRGEGAPPSAVSRGDVLFEKCVRERRVVSVKELFSAEKTRQLVEAILVAPLGQLDEAGTKECGVLVVHRLPLKSLNSQNVGVFSLLADWISRSLNLLERFESVEDSTSELFTQIQSRRLTTAFIQTLARVSPIETVALEVLGSEESSEVAYWNAAKMFGVAAQQGTLKSEEPFRTALDILLANGSHLGAVLTSLPIRECSPGSQGLRLRIQERAELNAQAALRVLKAYVTQFHAQLLPDLKVLENEISPSRRHYHLDNMLDKLGFLSTKKQALEFCLGLSRPETLPVTSEDLMLSLTHDPDLWTRRLAALASQELGCKVDEDILEALIHSDLPLDRELGSYLSEMLTSS